jgi:hypothetical protein
MLYSVTVTTGRKRRCGYQDLVVVKFSAAVNSYSVLNVTKLDVLDAFPTIKVATAYIHPDTGDKLESFPADLDLLSRVKVEYTELKGWETVCSFQHSPYLITILIISSPSLELIHGMLYPKNVESTSNSFKTLSEYT